VNPERAGRPGGHLTVATIPTVHGANQYQTALEASVAPHGVTFRDLDRLHRDDLGDVDLIHLHWIEFLYGAEGGRLWAEVMAHWRGLRLVSRLRSMAATHPIVWTAHNLRPHDSVHPRLDRLTFHAAARSADRIIAHSHHGAGQLQAAYDVDDDRITVIPHGNHDGQYPPPSAPRDELRAGLGLTPEDHAVLAFGQVRRYKRLPELIETFCATTCPDTVLVVAGDPWGGVEGERVRAAAAGRPHIRVELGHVSDQRVSDLHTACDAAVLNYRDVFSSGVLLLAWTFGLPVLAPAGTTADELATHPAVLPFAEGELSGALRMLVAADPAAARRAALSASARYRWEALGGEIRAVYDDALARFERRSARFVAAR
jgi:glycosyltransferase involved in cell wall biosynthesis